MNLLLLWKLFEIILLFHHSYDTIKAELQQGDMKIPLGPTMHMAAASSAGLITLVLTNPIFVVKTRLCLQFGPNAQCLSEKKRYKCGVKIPIHHLPIG